MGFSAFPFGFGEEIAVEPDALQPVKTDDDGLIELVEELQRIDTNHALAKLNETTISDNNGGRIVL